MTGAPAPTQPSHRLTPSPPETGRPGTPLRQTVIAAAAVAALGAAVWVSTVVETDPIHDLALFGHLVALIVGFGAVLVAEYHFALWVFRRITFAEAVVNTSRLHPLIWAGLLGLVATGALLRPDLTSTATVVKLALVAVLTVNGVQATALGRSLSATSSPTRRLLIRGGATSAISQICWWGAIVVGFLGVTS